jgi:hypothetical protein
VARTPAALAASHRMSERAVRLALEGPPLPPIRLHDLRHVAACLAYRATKDLKLVSQLMGHSGIQITADIYTTLFEEVDRAAAEAVAAIVPRTVRDALASQSPAGDTADDQKPDVRTMCAPGDKSGENGTADRSATRAS